MLTSRGRRAVAVFLAGSLVALMSALTSGLPSQAAVPRVPLPNTKPTWVPQAQPSGAPAASDQLTVRVVLKLRHASSVEALARQVSDPHNRSYGHYLSLAAFRTRFAPTNASVATVSAFLRHAGLRVTSVAEGNRWVSASGSVAQLSSVFRVSLKNYRWQGRIRRAPATPASVPASVASLISTVSGLTQPSLLAPMTRHIVPDPAAHSSRNARSAAPGAKKPTATTCSSYWGQHSQRLPEAYGKTRFPTYICGYGPAQLRHAYGTATAVSGGDTGRGVTVAVIDAYGSPTIRHDANAYAKQFSEPTFTRKQYRQTLFTPFTKQSTCGGEAGWNGEQTLDIEAVHAMAPGAKLHYVGAKNCEDSSVDDAVNYVVQRHSADIVSNSYGDRGEDLPADEIAIAHSLFIQAAIEGIGMYFSSGDGGDSVVTGLAPQPAYSSSDPYVTAVGGTSLLLDRRGATVTETGWESTLDFVDYSGKTAAYAEPLPGVFAFGAGGGASTLFMQPWYQKGRVPSALARQDRAHKMRVAPDLAADADPYTGFFYGETVDGTFTVDTIGGTSVATPLVAGIQAVASQHRRTPIGFANPLLYSLPRRAFHDTRHVSGRFASPSGSYIGFFDTGSTQVTQPGYDNTTGRGTPNGRVLLALEEAAGR